MDLLASNENKHSQVTIVLMLFLSCGNRVQDPQVTTLVVPITPHTQQSTSHTHQLFRDLDHMRWR